MSLRLCSTSIAIVARVIVLTLLNMVRWEKHRGATAPAAAPAPRIGRRAGARNKNVWGPVEEAAGNLRRAKAPLAPAALLAAEVTEVAAEPLGIDTLFFICAMRPDGIACGGHRCSTFSVLLVILITLLLRRLMLRLTAEGEAGQPLVDKLLRWRPEHVRGAADTAAEAIAARPPTVHLGAAAVAPTAPAAPAVPVSAAAMGKPAPPPAWGTLDSEKVRMWSARLAPRKVSTSSSSM